MPVHPNVEEGRCAAGSLLAGLTAAQRRTLLELGIPRRYNAGDVLLSEGEHTTFAVIIIDGYVKITARTKDGVESLLAIRTAGDIVGELAALDSAPRSATASAAGAVIARILSKAKLEACFRKDPGIAAGVNRAVAAKLRVATRHRVDFRSRGAQERLARALLELGEGSAGLSPRGELKVFFTQSELAALIGASEPTVHKALRALRDARVLDTSYRRLVVTDIDGLRAIAEGAH